MAGAAAATGAAGVVGAAAAATATAAAATGVAGTPGAGLLGGGAETVAAGGAAALLLASYLLMLALREAIAESISVFFVPYLSDHSLVVHVALHSVRKRSVSLMLGRVATVTATSTAAMCCAADVSVSYTTVVGTYELHARLRSIVRFLVAMPAAAILKEIGQVCVEFGRPEWRKVGHTRV